MFGVGNNPQVSAANSQTPSFGGGTTPQVKEPLFGGGGTTPQVKEPLFGGGGTTPQVKEPLFGGGGTTPQAPLFGAAGGANDVMEVETSAATTHSSKLRSNVFGQATNTGGIPPKTPGQTQRVFETTPGPRDHGSTANNNGFLGTSHQTSTRKSVFLTPHPSRKSFQPTTIPSTRVSKISIRDALLHRDGDVDTPSHGNDNTLSLMLENCQLFSEAATEGETGLVDCETLLEQQPFHDIRDQIDEKRNTDRFFDTLSSGSGDRYKLMYKIEESKTHPGGHQWDEWVKRERNEANAVLDGKKECAASIEQALIDIANEAEPLKAKARDRAAERMRAIEVELESEIATIDGNNAEKTATLNENLRIANRVVQEYEAAMNHRLALPELYVLVFEKFTKAFKVACDATDPDREPSDADRTSAQKLRTELEEIQQLISQKNVDAMAKYLSKKD